MNNEENMQQLCDPEKLSKHDLVNYLIAHPDAKGNFKFHTFLSCMWRNLLIARPEFIGVADLEKIHHHDMYKILLEQPQLAPYFDFSKLWDGENRCLFLKRPEIATPETTAYIYTSTWSEILRKYPHLAPLCPLHKFYPCDWIELLTGQLSFADRCPWEKFQRYDWAKIVEVQSSCLQYLKLEYLASAEDLGNILRSCYLGKKHSCKEIFAEGDPDAASYLIFKRMARTNCKHFLKKQLANGNWALADELSSISPEDVLDVYDKKNICFFITLAAPDNVFEKLFPLFDLQERDSGGNTHLFAALVRGLDKGDMSRYSFLLEQGLDPDEKNIAGFSCNDLVKHLEKLKAEAEAARLARNERARELARQRRKEAKKGNKNGR